ncbi:hypothetical protein [Tropicibacter alexandrii]|uniref:hypothetical protein n=1 Tax=Tropicibacter alexandrii TaxID=2267683 RepID=UPI001F0C01BE|nr:hypothetical protein [Tropicibacter alexandrii]
MRHQPDISAGWVDSTATHTLPAPLDSETRALLRLFLAPILETATSWEDLGQRLATKGYRLGFLSGHLVIRNEAGEAVCTGSGLGTPLAEIAARIGRPCVKAHPGGQSGELN